MHFSKIFCKNQMIYFKKIIEICRIMVYNVNCRRNPAKGNTENSVKPGRLCHPCTDFHKSGRRWLQWENIY